MTPLSRFVMLSLLACLFILPQAQAQSVDVDAAKREGKIVAYGTIIPKVMGALHQGFEKKYGIKVEYWRASATKVMDRALTEWRAGKPAFDVLFAIHGAMLLMKKEGMFIQYTPSSSEKFPAKYRDPDGILTSWRVTPIGILYNTELVKPQDAPKSLDDLLDPKWHRKIGMPDASRHTSTAQFLWNLQKVKGEKWLDFVKALAKQEPHLMESMAPVPNAIVRGEIQVGITYLQYVIQQKGPLGFVPLDKFLTDSNDLALSGKASRPNAAKLYMEYACSPEGQKTLAELGEFVLSPTAPPKITDAEKVLANLVFMDDPTPDQYKKLSVQFRQIFFGK